MSAIRPLIRPCIRPAIRSVFRGSAFDPVSLFANGEQGAFYLPEPQYLYQDSTGTTPVTADGDPVGLMLDKSGNGNHATQATSASRPVYRTDGTLHWLEFDGVDDDLNGSSVGESTDSFISIAAANTLEAISSFIKTDLTKIGHRSTNSAHFTGLAPFTAAKWGSYVYGDATVFTGRWSNSPSGESWVNQIPGSLTASNVSTSPTGIVIGSDGGSQFSKIDFYGSVILVNRFVTEPERLNVEQYLAQKADITL